MIPQARFQGELRWRRVAESLILAATWSLQMKTQQGDFASSAGAPDWAHRCLQLPLEQQSAAG